MSSKMFSSSSCNFRCLCYSNRGYKGGCFRGKWGNKGGSCWSSWGNWDISSSNSESIDIIRDVVDSLENSIGINILVTSSGDTKSILGFSSGRVNILVSKTELSKLILSMELTRWSCNWSNWNWGNYWCWGSSKGSLGWKGNWGSSKGGRCWEWNWSSSKRSYWGLNW